MASSSSCQYPSPSYQPLLPTSFDTQEDIPGPRCGHTLTAVAHRLILFGGSTAVYADGSGLSLEGVTNLVHCFTVFTKKWKRVYPDGKPPSPRAFHAASATGYMVAIQGGVGPSGPCTGEIYILNMTDNKFKWQKVIVVPGVAPGPRYGHAMGLAGRRLVIFGGAIGNEILDDTWALDTTQKPNLWERVNPTGNLPSGRMYASASTREDYYFLLCGGIDRFGLPLGDVYRLQMLEDGRWMWTMWPPVPGAAPSMRYQHTAVFVGSRLHVIGGALSRTTLIHGEAAVAVLDTATGEWLDRNGPGTCNLGSNGQYLNQLMRRCGHAAASVGYRIYVYGGLREGVLLDDFLVSEDDRARPSSSEAANASFMRRSSSESSLDRLPEAHANLPTVETAAFQASVSEGYARLLQRTTATVYLGGLVRQPSLDRFQRRLTTDMRASSYTLEFTTQKSTQELVKKVLSTLLRPQTWKPPASREFFLSYVEVEGLCNAAREIIKQEPTLLQLSAPIKVFGDIHGQFGDLMRLFYEYGYPSRKGDISYIDYLFLGDYVDRGTHSLETIILLLALKIEYPENIHLIRGNHESCGINAVYGFKEECKERMGKHDGEAAWSQINDVFDHLPLAALIEDKILCMHGGIGSTVFSVEQIANIQRPVFPDKQDSSNTVLKDLLWSDPTANDSVLGVGGSSRGDYVVSFGPDVVKAFCERNKLDMIIRAHECVLDGFERFAQGKLITVFSATNYCGIIKNAGAILVIGRDLVIIPKLIHPLPPPISPSEDSPEKAWMPLDSERPPTPARGRPNPCFEIGSTS